MSRNQQGIANLDALDAAPSAGYFTADYVNQTRTMATTNSAGTGTGSWRITATPVHDAEGKPDPSRTDFQVIDRAAGRVMYFSGAVLITNLGGSSLLELKAITVTDPDGVTIELSGCGDLGRPVSIMGCTLRGDLTVTGAEVLAQDSDFGAGVTLQGSTTNPFADTRRTLFAVSRSTIGEGTQLVRPPRKLGTGAGDRLTLAIDLAKIGAGCTVGEDVGPRNEVDDNNSVFEPLPTRTERTLVDESILRALDSL